MSSWGERLKKNSIWQHLNELGPAIDEAEKREEIPAEDLESLERLRAVLTFVGKSLDTADPYLLKEGSVDALAGLLPPVIQHVQTYTADGNPENLRIANGQIETLIDRFAATIVLPHAPGELAGLRESVTSYRAAMAKSLSDFQAKAAKHQAELKVLEAKLEEARTAVSAEQQRLTTVISEFEVKFSASQDARAQEHAAAETARQTRSDSAFAEFQSQFSSAQDKRSQNYDDAQTKRQTRFDDLHAEYTQQLNNQKKELDSALDEQSRDHEVAIQSLRTNHEATAQEILKKIEGYRDEAKSLLGVIGDHGVTYGHKTAADEAHGQVRIWQIITVGALLILAGVASLSAFSAVNGNLGWSTLAARFYLSVAVGLLAGYGANQANKYQQIERRNRKLQLELQAIGPFLEPVPEEKRQQFRLTIADRSFGREEGGVSSTPGPASLVDLAKTKEGQQIIVDILRKFFSTK